VEQMLTFEYQGTTYTLRPTSLFALEASSGEQLSVQRGLLTDVTACLYDTAAGVDLDCPHHFD
jgi:hypothetical protein